MQVHVKYDEMLPYVSGDYRQHIVEVSGTIQDDGSFAVTERKALAVLQSEANRYMHVVGRPQAAPTEAQRATVAKWYLSREDRPATPGKSLCAWAFAGSDPQEISKRYGDGRRVLLNGPEPR